MIDTAALREKVLDLAIRGKLVPQDPNDEPASVLLERIHEQKLQMVREGKLKAKDVKDDTIIFKGDDNCYYEKYSDGSVKNIQDEIPFDLPAGWSWCRLNSICNLISDIDHKMPKSVNDGVLFLSAKDLLNDGTINYDVDVKRISEEDYLRLSKKAVPQINDIIYSRIGACLGKARVVNRNVRFLVSYSCCTIRPLMIDSTFLALILDGNFVLKQAKKETQSVGVPDLGIKNIKDFLIPIPPLNEQSRIDTCLKNALSLVDNISYNATCVDEYIDVLQSRILELAIQGKLVPQDENDEPASVLLERIRAERKAKLGKKYVESYIYKGDDNCYYENNDGKVAIVNEFLPFDLPDGWVYVRLENVLNYEQPTEYIVESTDYRSEYKTPVLTAGKSFIIGYTNETVGIKSELPVIIFDDFTTDSKFVNFPFKVKSSAMKILTADKLSIDTKYAYYVMQTVECDHETHKRYWISEYGRTIIGLPPLNEQLKIVNQIEYLFSLLDNGNYKDIHLQLGQ